MIIIVLGSHFPYRAAIWSPLLSKLKSIAFLVHWLEGQQRRKGLLESLSDLPLLEKLAPKPALYLAA